MKLGSIGVSTIVAIPGDRNAVIAVTDPEARKHLGQLVAQIWMARRTLIAVLLVRAYGVIAAAGQIAPAGSGSATLGVSVRDQSQLPVPSALIQMTQGARVIAATSTGQSGSASFPALKPGRYTVSASKEGFETAIAEQFEWREGVPGSLELTLKAAASKQSVEVHETTSSVEATSSPSAAVKGALAKEVPNRPATVRDALPLIPGIVRSPGGKLQLSGSAEHRGAMIVNSADVTDPATGEFGLTVPIDSVDNLNFYQTSFLGEYGRFSAGLISVETKPGGDNWEWELNDPLPEFNIRSWGLRGLRTATPRLNVEGPLEAAVSSHQNQFEHWINEARRRLPPLRGKKPETKARQFWALWPEISVALEDRQSVKGITLWLAEHIEPSQSKSPIIQASADSTPVSREIKPALPPLRKPSTSDSNRDNEPDIADDPMAVARRGSISENFTTPVILQIQS